MNAEQMIQKGKNEKLTYEDLRTLVSDRSVYGADVVEMLTAQSDRRKDEAQAARDASAERELKASEQRAFDRALNEASMIAGLIRDIEARTAQRAHVPETQTAVEMRTTEPAIVPAVVTRDEKVSTWLQQRGGFSYQGERGAESMRLGRVIRAMALGNRAGLSSLEQRVLSEGSDSSGGYTVPEIIGGQFIDRVRNRMAVMAAGAVTVPMQSDVLHLARLGQPDSVSPTIDGPTWHTENSEITEGDLALERVTLTARTLPMLITLSVELSEDSQGGMIDAIIEREMAQALALELDRAALLGSGSAPEPRGVKNQSGITTLPFSGTPTNYDFLVDAIGECWQNNFEPTGRLYNATLATTIAKFKSSADSQPLVAPAAVAAVPEFRTNQVPLDGTSPETTSVFVADWRELLVGIRTTFRIEVSRVSGDSFKKLQIQVRSYLRADIALSHPEAFVVRTLVGV